MHDSEILLAELTLNYVSPYRETHIFEFCFMMFGIHYIIKFQPNIEVDANHDSFSVCTLRR